jgi:hypothetical protein
MAVDMSRMDVPRDVLEQQIRDLVARQREQAPTTQPDTTPEEGQS